MIDRAVKLCGALLLSTAIVCGTSLAQQTQKPMTNKDVTTMVKGGLPESVVVAAIQSRPANYDTSPAALVALKKAGVTDNELNAIMAASSNGSSGGNTPAAAPAGNGAAPNAPQPPSAPNMPKSRIPSVIVDLGGNSQQLVLEKTQLAETKTKPSSMASLAGDSALTQAIQAGVGTTTASVASHVSSGVGSSTVQQAGNIFSGMLARRKPLTTYVWGVPNPASGNILQTATPSFTVYFASTTGVNPNDFAPAIVRLTPAQNTCRIVGATRGKDDARSSAAADWEMYSSFLEERVAINSQKIKAGEYQISPSTALEPGEYAVVLRPVSKAKKFSGGDVSRAQGDGLMFDAVWSFEISDDAQ